ncbi:MAG: DUF167 domain-containing protein [Elusimicrobiota bacterium]
MVIRVRVIANAKHSEVMGRLGSVVRVRIAAPAIDGKANEELIQFLAEFFEVRKSSVSILKGEKGKEKIIQVEGKPDHQLEHIMQSIP